MKSEEFSDELFRVLFESAPDALLIADETGKIRLANSAAHYLFGWGSGRLRGRSIEQLMPKHLREAHRAHRAAYSTRAAMRPMGLGLRLTGLRKDGAEFPVDISLSPVQWKGQRLVIVAVRDITQRRRIETTLQDALEAQALRDPLTGLFNRRMLDESLAREFARARRTATGLAVVMADIDHFKKVNDSFGHAAGDQVLKNIAHVLETGMRKGDLVCRYGGEEFTLLMPGSSAAQAARRAEAMRRAIQGIEQRSPDDCAVGPVTVSFGVAAFPEHGRNPEQVLRHADMALLTAKSDGRNRVVIAVGHSPCKALKCESMARDDHGTLAGEPVHT